MNCPLTNTSAPSTWTVTFAPPAPEPSPVEQVDQRYISLLEASRDAAIRRAESLSGALKKVLQALPEPFRPSFSDAPSSPFIELVPGVVQNYVTSRESLFQSLRAQLAKCDSTTMEITHLKHQVEQLDKANKWQADRLKIYEEGLSEIGKCSAWVDVADRFEGLQFCLRTHMNQKP